MDKKLEVKSVRWYHFWNPDSGLAGGFVIGLMVAIAGKLTGSIWVPVILLALLVAAFTYGTLKSICYNRRCQHLFEEGIRNAQFNTVSGAVRNLSKEEQWWYWKGYDMEQSKREQRGDVKGWKDLI